MARWKVGGYKRLSKEDGDKDESNSIITQNLMIENYIKNLDDAELIDNYEDDGFTGTDTNRPGFKRLYNDIVTGRINTVIVKDLSRLGRNYLQVGNFIEEVIPMYNLRFISINDNVDTYLKPESLSSLDIPFKNLMNENYAKDISNKVRSSFETIKKRGDYIGCHPIFGYLKDKNDCHKFVVDPTAANIVKKIFDMALKGYTRQEIVKYLNDNHILTPSKYFKTVLKYYVVAESNKWSINSVDIILKNEIYTGVSIQGKTTRISHKIHNVVKVAEENWIRTENHHKPIVSKEIYDSVQDLLYNRNRRLNKNGKYGIYSGHLKCEDCGYSLTIGDRRYRCSTYKQGKGCTSHSIREKELDYIVTEAFNKYIDLLCEIENVINENLINSKISYNNEYKEIRLIELNKEINKYEDLLSNLKKDYELNYIEKNDFEDYSEKYLCTLNTYRVEKEEIQNSKNFSLDLQWIKDLKGKRKVEKMNKLLVDDFIDNIIVSEDKKVKVVFKYKDKLEQTIKYLKSLDFMI